MKNENEDRRTVDLPGNGILGEFMTVEDVADMLRINKSTVYRMAKAGRIPATRVGRQWRFRLSALEDSGLLSQDFEPALDRWVEEGADPLQRQARRERADITFGLRGAPWDGERVLERYELLYEAGLVYEALRDAELSSPDEPPSAISGTPKPGLVPGRSMVLDHRRIVATALGRLRGKIRYRPVVFELLPSTFTYLQLQRVVEALAGVRLHKQNFRRLVEKGGLVEGTGQLVSHTGGRPAELFRFRHEVLRERPTPGVGLPVSTADALLDIGYSHC